MLKSAGITFVPKNSAAIVDTMRREGAMALNEAMDIDVPFPEKSEKIQGSIPGTASARYFERGSAVWHAG